MQRHSVVKAGSKIHQNPLQIFDLGTFVDLDGQTLLDPSGAPLFPDDAEAVLLEEANIPLVQRALDGLDLFHPDAAKRQATARRLGNVPDADILPILEKALGKETDPDVQAVVTEALNKLRLTSPDAGVRIKAMTRGEHPNFKSVLENLRVGLVAHNLPSTPIPDAMFQLFPVLQTMLHRKGGVLSGGQQRQLAIARALVTRPTLLLLDEPTEGIQPSVILEIEDVIQRIKSAGNVSILLVEQYLEFASRLADHVDVMEKGAIVADAIVDVLDLPQTADGAFHLPPQLA